MSAWMFLRSIFGSFIVGFFLFVLSRAFLCMFVVLCFMVNFFLCFLFRFRFHRRLVLMWFALLFIMQRFFFFIEIPLLDIFFFVHLNEPEWILCCFVGVGCFKCNIPNALLCSHRVESVRSDVVNVLSKCMYFYAFRYLRFYYIQYDFYPVLASTTPAWWCAIKETFFFLHSHSMALMWIITFSLPSNIFHFIVRKRPVIVVLFTQRHWLKSFFLLHFFCWFRCSLLFFNWTKWIIIF